MKLDLASILKSMLILMIGIAVFYATSIADTVATAKVSGQNIEPEEHYKSQKEHNDDLLAHEKMREAQKAFFQQQTTLILNAISEIER